MNGEGRRVDITTDELRARLRADGYYADIATVRDDEAECFVLEVSRSLGELYAPPDCDPAKPILRTAQPQHAGAGPHPSTGLKESDGTATSQRTKTALN